MTELAGILPPFQSLPCARASAAALFRSAPAFGGSGAEMRCLAEAEGLSYAHFSRNGYLPNALIFIVGPLRGAVLLARPKVPKNRHGALPHVPGTPNQTRRPWTARSLNIAACHGALQKEAGLPP